MKRLISTLSILSTFSIFALVTVSFCSVAGAAELKAASQTGNARISLNALTTPLKQGKNTLTLKVVDAKTGKPLDAKEVKVETTMSAKEMETMGMKGMGDGTARTQVVSAGKPGTFSVKTSLPFGGNWQMKATLVQPATTAVFDVPVK